MSRKNGQTHTAEWSNSYGSSGHSYIHIVHLVRVIYTIRPTKHTHTHMDTRTDRHTHTQSKHICKASNFRVFIWVANDETYIMSCVRAQNRILMKIFISLTRKEKINIWAMGKSGATMCARNKSQ